MVLLALGALSLRAGDPAGAMLFVTLPASEFRDVLGTSALRSPIDGAGLYQRYCADAYCEMIASARLPHLSRFATLELDGCKTVDSGVAFTVGLYRTVVLETDPVPETVVELEMAPGGCHPAAVSLPVLSEHLIDNAYSYYHVVVRIGAVCFSGECPPAPTLDERFQGIRLLYLPTQAGVVEPTASFASPPP